MTGACSGIGLALTQHLLRHTPSASQPYRWRVVLADVRADSFEAASKRLPASPDSGRVLFVPTDVSSWSDNADLFEKAYRWARSSSTTAASEPDGAAGGRDGVARIDFLAANAGTDDKERIQAVFDLDEPPQPPDLRCLDVNLISVFYQIKLFIHYARKTRRDLGQRPASGESNPTTTTTSDHSSPSSSAVDPLPYQPKITITSSCVGQYPFPPAPQYCAAKHGLLGLVRSIAPSMLTQDSIAVNAVLPAFVPTALAPAGLVAAWPREHVTPRSTVVAAFAELMHEHGRVAGIEVESDDDDDNTRTVRVVSDGEEGMVKNGCCVECAGNHLYYRDHVDFPNDSQRWMVVDQVKEGGLWVGGSGYGKKVK